MILIRAVAASLGQTNGTNGTNGSAGRPHDHNGVVDAVSAALVRRCGLPADRLDVVAAPATPVAAAVAIARVGAEAADTFLTYWFGPVMSGDGGMPHLPVGSAVPGFGGGTLAFADLLALVAGSPAPRRAIVLDAWLGDSAGPSTDVLAARLAEITQARGPGVEVLVSVAPDETTFGAEAASPAAGRIGELLSRGDPDAPAEFSVGRVHDLIIDALAAQASVSARRVPAGWADDFAIATNPGRVAPLRQTEPVPTTVLPDSALRLPVPEAGTLVAAAAAGGGDQQECPYPGLKSFGATSERFFFGRAELVAETLSKLRERAGAAGPLVLVGASGSGKSSLLRAGVLPAVARGALGDAVPAGSVHVLLTPTEHPLEVLVTRVAEVLAAPALGSVLRDALRTDPERFAEVLADLLAPGGDRGAEQAEQDAVGRRLVIAVDQFEETFTLCADEGEREAFIRALCAAAVPTATGRPAPAVVMLAVRGDFYLRCAAYPPLVAALQNGQIVVGPMDRAEVREAVVEPARAVGMEVEPALVDLMLDDLGVGDEDTGRGPAASASLPLLAHALRVTWDERAGRTLTVAGYRRAGRLAGALAKTADDLFTGFGHPGQQAARSLLLKLVRVGDGGQVTRRPMAWEALLAEVPDPGAEAVLDKLVRSRLVEVDEGRVQIAHEELPRSWPRLRDWIELDQAGVMIRQQLDDGGREWEDHGRDPSYLIGGIRLAAAREWVEVGDRRRSLGQPAGDFYDAAIARERAAGVATRRRTRRLRAMVAGLTVLVLIAAGLTVLAFDQRSAANDARDRAQSQRIAGVADDQHGGRPEVGAHLALAARTFADTWEARSSILEATTPIRRLGAHASPIGAVAYSPDGRLVATGGDDATAALWDGAQPEERGRLGRLPAHTTGKTPYAVKAVAFDRGSRILATGTSNAFTRLWDVRDPAKPVLVATLPQATDGPEGGVYGLAFSPTADVLAVGGYGTTVRLFDVADPANPRPLDTLGDPGDADRHAKVVRSVAFSPDGTKLLTGGSDGRAILWDVSRPSGPAVPLADLVDPEFPDIPPNAVAVGFSPDGRFLARSNSSFVLLFELDGASGAVTFIEQVGVGSTVSDLVVLDEGAVAAVSAFNHVHLLYPRWSWEVVDELVLARRGWALAASPDGRRLVVGTEDRDLRFFPWRGTMVTDSLDVASVAAGPSGGRVYLGTVGGDVMAYDADPGGEGAATLAGWADDALVFYPDPEEERKGTASYGVFGLRLTPDERVLLTATVEGVKFWDVSPGALEAWDRRPSQGITVFREGYQAERVLPEPLASITAADASAEDRSLRRYNSIDLSADGTRLAVGDNRGAFEIWDVSDPKQPRMLERRAEAHTDASSVVVAFSPDGRLVATTGNDGWVRIWDADDVAGDPLDAERYGGRPYALAFSPSDPLLAVAGTDRVTHLVDVSTPADIVKAASTSPSRSVIHSVAFSPDGTRLVTGGVDVKLWDLGADGGDPVLVADLGAASGVSDLAFSPDGRYVLPAYDDLPTTAWLPADVDAYAEQLCRSFGDPVTAEEWGEYLPDVAYRAPCAD